MYACRTLRFLLIASVIGLALATAWRSPLQAQQPPPVINKIEVKASPGEEVELTLRGKGLAQILRVDRVRIGEEDVRVLNHSSDSDDVLRIWIQIPQDAQPGRRYAISVLASGETFSGWLRPVGFPEIEVAVEGERITDGQPVPVDFGVTRVGTPVERTFRVSNVGTGTLSLSASALPAGLRITGSLPDRIAPGDSARLRLRLEAVAAGPLDGVVRLATNDAEKGSFEFRVVGRIDPPPAPPEPVAEAPATSPADRDLRPPRPEPRPTAVIQMFEGATRILPQSSGIEFDTTTVGVPVKKTVRIENGGTVPLTLTDPVLPPGFRLVGSAPGEIPAGGSANLVVQMEAATENTFGGTLRFDTNPGGGTSFAVPIRGTVVAAASVLPSALPPWVWVVPATVLGAVAVFGVRYFRMRARTAPRASATATPVAPIFKFQPQKDIGTQRIPEWSSVRPELTVRIKAMVDAGRQDLQAKERLVLDTIEVVDSRTEARSNKDTDDLKRVEGIGPKISALLQTSGISTFAALAATDATRLEQILHEAGIHIADPTSWPEQARLAAAGDWQGLDQLQAELKGGRVVDKEG